MRAMKNDLKRGRDQQPADAGPDEAAEREPPRLIRSEELFAGQRIVLIQHAGEQYRLLITRNDRLILQK